MMLMLWLEDLSDVETLGTYANREGERELSEALSGEGKFLEWEKEEEAGKV